MINKRIVLISLSLIAFLGVSFISRGECSSFDSAVAQIPIQHNGRIKPFEAFARETLRFISTKEKWQKKSAIEIMFSNLAHPQAFVEIPFIRVDHLELKKMLHLSSEEKYFSYQQLKPMFQLLISLLQSAQEKRDKELKPTTLEQAAETVYQRLMTVDQLAAGELIKVIPQGEAWESPYLSSGVMADQFKKLIEGYNASSKDGFSDQVNAWISDVTAQNKNVSMSKIHLENNYYRLKPFYYAWILYLAAFLLFTFVPQNGLWPKLSILTVLCGFLAHSVGLILRIVILERPPVSNMYESVVFMDWILMAFALVFFAFKRKSFILSAGALMGVVIMLFGDLLPVEKSLDVLAPVLRSNYWLTIHVLTIVASYGILGLAAALAHRQLFLNAINKLSAEQEISSANVLTRLLQIGLITLGIGTVLGGVWANESWGRFWGWDPKETWALITFLGYLVLIRLRSNGKLNNFMLAVGADLGFLLVLMTWYGVNFILGRGLHSYGFGGGGVMWVIGYLIFETIFFGFIVFKRFSRKISF